MAIRSGTGGAGSREFEEQAARRQRERQEAGLEPEKHPGPRQNEGISSAGHLYATQAEADASSDVGRRQVRTDVDRKAAQVRGDGATEEPARRAEVAAAEEEPVRRAEEAAGREAIRRAVDVAAEEEPIRE